MAVKKIKSSFICQSCGYVSPKWAGRCPSCEAWSSLVEEKVTSVSMRKSDGYVSQVKPVPLSQITTEKLPRIQTHSQEFNRVLGGGLVPGSVVLIGGDPGIGKSTLLLQEGARISGENFKILYVTGEESAEQTRLRADRLGLSSEHLLILAETALEATLAAIESLRPRLVVLDSIQTVFSGDLESAPGSISQVRECARQMITIAKTQAIPFFIIGHVTKEGYIAGPKVLEHMVDTLLQFEGDRDHYYRILRSVKNRFGSTREIGVFEMTEAGMIDVDNPSELFLSERFKGAPGTSVSCVLEGTRPILVELQALVSPTNYGLPQRVANGMDHKRVALLLAVLEKRIGIRTGTLDVFVNVVGGMRIVETASDLAIITSIVSSARNRPVDPETVLIGEVGLGGEIRAVARADKRVAEAQRMGFKNIILPQPNLAKLNVTTKINLMGVKLADEALEFALQ